MKFIMYEEYSRQALPSKKYRELLGSALCVFNSNNAFIIENILANDAPSKYNWHQLIDLTSGRLLEPVENTITKYSNADIATQFKELKDKRDRIIHSFQVTAPAGSGISDDKNNQILATKYKDGRQEYITEQFLLDFIKLNEDLSSKLHKFRGN